MNLLGLIFRGEEKGGWKMKPHSILTAAALLALAACGGGADNQAADANEAADAGNDSANAAAPALAPAANDQEADASGAVSGDLTLNRDFMVGRWTEMGDCAMDAAEFRADGSFVFPWGDRVPWQLDGNRLTVTGNQNPFTVTVVDRNSLRVDKGGGSVRTWTRC